MGGGGKGMRKDIIWAVKTHLGGMPNIKHALKNCVKKSPKATGARPFKRNSVKQFDE